MPAEPHVFVSYSHDSEAHREHVVQLVQQLRAAGVNVWFDRFEVEPPSEGWPQWLERQVALATRILVVCTETFRKQFEGDALGGIGWESYALRNALAHGAKLIPVLLEGGSSQHVPRELRALTAFYLPEQLPQLLYRLGFQFQDDGPPIVDVYPTAAALARNKPGVDLVLHGHVHQGDTDQFLPRGGQQPLSFSAVGSFGVAVDHRPGDDLRGRVPNELAIVELSTAGPLRRSVTTFFVLSQDPMGRWDWHARQPRPPQPL